MSLCFNKTDLLQGESYLEQQELLLPREQEPGQGWEKGLRGGKGRAQVGAAARAPKAGGSFCRNKAGAWIAPTWFMAAGIFFPSRSQALLLPWHTLFWIKWIV